MKLQTDSNRNLTAISSIKNTCVTACRNVLAQMNRAKEAVLAEFRDGFRLPEHLLQLALNEAEALAWQTSYPHLVFADLATEKAEALLAWQAQQRRALSRSRIPAPV